MHVGQPALDAVVVEGQALVVHAKEVERGGVEVVAVGRVLGGLEAQVVSGAIEGTVQPGSQVSAQQPSSTGAVVVKSTVPVGTNRGVHERILRSCKYPVDVASNPEFLAPMLESPGGQMALWIALGLELGGCFTLWRMLRSV